MLQLAVMMVVVVVFDVMVVSFCLFLYIVDAIRIIKVDVFSPSILNCLTLSFPFTVLCFLVYGMQSLV